MGRALAALVERTAPELVIASGDLTNRGRRDQHERAHAALASLGPPVLAVPGNHDVPYAFPARFTRPWAEFERLWGTVEPVHATAALHVVGLNSVRPFRHQGGALDSAQLSGRPTGWPRRRTAPTASWCSTTTCSARRGGRRGNGRSRTAAGCCGRSSRPAPTSSSRATSTRRR